METIRYRPVIDFPEGYRPEGIHNFDYGFLDEHTCKSLYLAGKIDDNWTIEVHIPDEDTLIEKPSTLFNK